MMQLSVHLRSSADATAVGEAARSPARSAARQTARGASRAPTRNSTPMPPGTPWMADPVIAAWQAEDPEAGRALAACLYETLSQELRGIETLGAEVKDLSVGLTVFPSYLDGNSEVLLSWTVAEAEIRTFYSPQSGYRHRKPVEGRTFTAVRTPAGQLRE
jgi:hypothetical protein